MLNAVQRTRIMGVRLTPDELRWIAAAARRRGVAPSAWARMVLKDAAAWKHPSGNDEDYAAIRNIEREMHDAMTPDERLAAASELSEDAKELCDSLR